MVGAWIRDRRKGMGLSQAALAARLGVSQVQVSCWETNKHRPAEHQLAKLVELLGPQDGTADTLPGGRNTVRDPATASRPARTFTPDDFVTFGTNTETGFKTIGKVVEKSGAAVEVEIFRAPVAPEFERVAVPADGLEPAELVPQTLVYCRQGTRWSMGRIVSREVSGHFAVMFPNEREARAIPKGALFVRSARFPDDPTTLLAAQVTSSPNFTEARHRFTEFVGAQRATYRGLTALATARIEFHAHQVAAVRRVLSDPVHRYLLADEVGLGKTIEAGLLIAQHVIDEGESASVLLVVPDALVDQWKEELAKSFSLRNDPRIRILPFTALVSTDRARLSSPAPTLTVIDEAHRSATWAFPPERDADAGVAGIGNARYRMLESLARCPKLLLLSGTPVLHHEDGFLAMLHLLEPDAYDLADREGFRRRIAARKVVADALSELTADFQAGFLLDALARLSSEVPFDDELSQRIGAVTSALASDPSTAGPAVEELRSYLLERYRLHRRIVRTHRDSRSIAHLLPKRCGTSFFGPAEDPLRLRAFEALDGWRRRVLDEATEYMEAATAVFGGLLAQAFSHPRQLARAFEHRADALRTSRTAALFPGEESWLQDIAQELARTTGAEVRTAALIEQLIGPLAGRRAVIFVDAPEEAGAVVEQLQRSTELRQRVLRFVPGEPRALALYERGSNSILVCDREAEEGLNLQKKPATIVFLDLPFDVGRIEQRIGRFDRLEGMKELRFLAAKPVGSYETRWARLLDEQIKIFGRSVARLQYVLAEAMERLRHDLFDMGPEEAFEAASARFADPKTGLEAALKQLRRQEALDVTEWRDDELRAFEEAVSEARAASSEEACDAIEGWLRQLQFEVEDTPERGTRYIHVRRGRGGNTLFPLFTADRVLDRWLDEETSIRESDTVRRAFGPFVFDPAEASETASLLGVGHPFFDVIFARMRVDDRSRSWGMWRCHPNIASPQVYVCFEFSIEANLACLAPVARMGKTIASLRRRADEMLAVEHRRTWMDFDGQLVTDKALLGVLQRPYDKGTRAAGDQNLNQERWALANQLLPAVDWGARINALRKELEEAVRAEPDLLRRCKAAEAKILGMEQHAVRVLRSRAAHAPAREKQSIEAAIRFEEELGEALRQAVRAPDFTVDNVGVIILAPQPLP